MRLLWSLSSLGFLVSSAHAQSSPAQRELASPPVFSTARPGQRQGTMLDSTGWRFAAPPRVNAIDDKSGTVRFRIVVGENGGVESVTPVSSTVSAAQEKLCREALQAAHFTPMGAAPRRTAGYYTFRFMVR